jgi:hypothetical protein
MRRCMVSFHRERLRLKLCRFCLQCPRRPHLHCDNTPSVMIPEEGMSVMRLPTRHGVRPRTLLVLAVLMLTSCQTAYYAAMEKLGYPKRELLVSRVQQARDSQQAAKEQFQSALERFRAVVHFRGGELEAKYLDTIFRIKFARYLIRSLLLLNTCKPDALYAL